MSARRKFTPKRKPRQSVVVPNETKRSKFRRLASRRMSRIVLTVDLLGNLASPTYEYTEAEINAMERTLLNKIQENFSKFRRKRKSAPRVGFSFDDMLAGAGAGAG